MFCPRRSLAVVSLLLAGSAPTSGCSPAPPPSTTPGPAATATSAALPQASITAKLTLGGLIDVAPSSDGAWYIRVGESGGILGVVTDGAPVREAAVGRFPFAVAATETDVYVAEARPDTGNDRRQNLIERIDKKTLQVVASTAFADPVDVVATETAIWAVGSDGVLSDFEPDTLDRRSFTRLAGTGPAQMVVADGFVWVVNAGRDASSSVVHRIDSSAPTENAIPLPGGGTFGTIVATPTSVWVGTVGEGPGIGKLFEVSFEGKVGRDLTLPAPVGLVAGDANLVWWASADGHVGSIDVASGQVGNAISVGTSGACLAGSGRTLWACEDTLVVLQTPP
jgi:hypothetical protein